jgi:hypothetical protein
MTRTREDARFQANQDRLSDGIRGQVRAYRVIRG